MKPEKPVSDFLARYLAFVKKFAMVDEIARMAAFSGCPGFFLS